MVAGMRPAAELLAESGQELPQDKLGIVFGHTAPLQIVGASADPILLQAIAGVEGEGDQRLDPVFPVEAVERRGQTHRRKVLSVVEAKERVVAVAAPGLMITRRQIAVDPHLAAKVAGESMETTIGSRIFFGRGDYFLERTKFMLEKIFHGISCLGNLKKESDDFPKENLG